MRESPLQLSPPTFLGNFEDPKSPHFVRFSPLARRFPLLSPPLWKKPLCMDTVSVTISATQWEFRSLSPPFNWSHMSTASRANMASSLSPFMSASQSRINTTIIPPLSCSLFLGKHQSSLEQTLGPSYEFKTQCKRAWLNFIFLVKLNGAYTPSVSIPRHSLNVSSANQPYYITEHGRTTSRSEGPERKCAK